MGRAWSSAASEERMAGYWDDDFEDDLDETAYAQARLA